MAALAAAMSLMHSHATVGLHQNLASTFGCSKIAHLKTSKFSVSRFASVPSSHKPSLSRPSIKRNSSMSFNNGPTAENFNENDEEYVDSTVVEALEVKSGPEGFVIKMRDGCFVKCVHNKSDGGKLPDYAPQPAIVLQLNDGSNLLLPIIVLELPSTMLLEAVRNVQVSRPTVYQVMNNMLELMGYKAKLVRVTKRVHEAYYARVYLMKEGDEAQALVSLDLRPSDAINLAVRCKIPIQVNKELALGDGVRIISEPARLPSRIIRNGTLITDMDRPESGECEEAGEFILVRSMLIAAVEERYIDAAKLRDELQQFRSKTRSRSKFNAHSYCSFNIHTHC